MTTQSLGAGRTDSLIATSTMATQSIDPTRTIQPISPSTATLELILATMTRLESRMDEYDRRPTVAAHPTRPEPDPPYGMPRNWNSNTMSGLTSPPGFSVANSGLLPTPSMPTYATAAITAPTPVPPVLTNTGIPYHQSYTQPIFTPFEHSNPSLSAGFASTTGLHQNPPPKTLSSWDPPGALHGRDHQNHQQGSCWDNPALHHQTGQNYGDQARYFKMDPPRFNGSNAPNWISRIQYYFDHLMMPDNVIRPTRRGLGI